MDYKKPLLAVLEYVVLLATVIFLVLFVLVFSFSATRLVYYLKRYILHAEYLRESVEDEFPFFSHDSLLILIKR